MYKWWNDGWGMIKLWDVNEIMVHDGCVDAVSIETRNIWIIIALLVCTSKWSAQCITSSLVIPWGERWREGVREGQQVFALDECINSCMSCCVRPSLPPPQPSIYMAPRFVIYINPPLSGGASIEKYWRGCFPIPPFDAIRGKNDSGPLIIIF